jgi:hypothetical protein
LDSANFHFYHDNQSSFKAACSGIPREAKLPLIFDYAAL